MTALVDWVSGLPVGMLYLLVGVSSFLEGIIPPVPGDVAAAFLAFIASRSGGAWLPTTLCVSAGSVGGNLIVWWIGRRYGAEWLARQMARFKLAKSEEQAEAAERRIELAYAKYGWLALFVSRFVPGVRAMAPAAAGAMRIPLWETAAVLFAASVLWYGAVCWVAFKVGDSWEEVKAALGALGRDAGLLAIVLALVLGIAGWRLWKRHRGPLP